MKDANLTCKDHRIRFVWTFRSASSVDYLSAKKLEIDRYLNAFQNKKERTTQLAKFTSTDGAKPDQGSASEQGRSSDQSARKNQSGGRGHQLWEERPFTLSNSEALLPHIRDRFHDGTEGGGKIKRVRLSKNAKRLFKRVRYAYCGNKEGAGDVVNETTHPHHLRFIDAQVLFFPDATVACMMDFTASLEQNKRSEIPASELTSTLCKARRALSNRNKTLLACVGESHKDESPTVGEQFNLSELRDNLFAHAPVNGARGDRREWPNPLFFSMVRLDEDADTADINELTFRLANAFDDSYILPESSHGLVNRTPLGNRFYAASRAGAVAVHRDNNTGFCKEAMTRFERDVFRVYLIALHQRGELLYLIEENARLLTREKVRSAQLHKREKKNLDRLRRALQEFMTHTRARQVSDHLAYSEAYACFWGAMGLNELFQSANESIQELNSYLEREKDRRHADLQEALLYLGLPLTIASWVIGMNLREFKENMSLWTDPDVVGLLVGAFLGSLLLVLAFKQWKAWKA
jgi:hypothetical protein